MSNTPATPEKHLHLKIQISGPSGSGKTLMRDAIAAFLHRNGFTLSSEDAKSGEPIVLDDSYLLPKGFDVLRHECAETFGVIDISTEETGPFKS